MRETIPKNIPIFFCYLSERSYNLRSLLCTYSNKAFNILKILVALLPIFEEMFADYLKCIKKKTLFMFITRSLRFYRFK